MKKSVILGFGAIASIAFIFLSFKLWLTDKAQVETEKMPCPYYTYHGERKIAEFPLYTKLPLYDKATGDRIPWKYDENKFDCSEMSAAYERAFEEAGYNARLVHGYSIFGGHGWVEVEAKEGVWLTFEATRQRFVQAENYRTFILKTRYNNITEALNAVGAIAKDFDWWNNIGEVVIKERSVEI